jgi:hypothetical protein
MFEIVSERLNWIQAIKMEKDIMFLLNEYIVQNVETI